MSGGLSHVAYLLTGCVCCSFCLDGRGRPNVIRHNEYSVSRIAHAAALFRYTHAPRPST